jgi:hypothetical protein
MLSFADIPVQGIEYDIEVCLVIQEVGVADVDEKSPDIVLADIVGISLLNIEQIFIRYGLFVGAVAPPDIGL